MLQRSHDSEMAPWIMKKSTPLVASRECGSCLYKPVPPFLPVWWISTPHLTNVRMTSSAPLLAAHMNAVRPSMSGSSLTSGRDTNTSTVAYRQGILIVYKRTICWPNHWNIISTNIQNYPTYMYVCTYVRLHLCTYVHMDIVHVRMYVCHCGEEIL